MEQIIQFLFEGIAFDLFKRFLGVLVMSTALSMYLNKALGKLKERKELLYAFISTFIFLFTLTLIVSPFPKQANLSGSIYDALTVPSNNGRDTVQFITIQIENNGGAQSAAKNWSAEAVIDGTSVTGQITMIPESLPVPLFDPGPSDPERVVFHKADDIVLKSMAALQSGEITVGVLQVKFKNLDSAAFRNGGVTVVRYEDVFSKKYSAQVKMTAKNHAISRSPGLTTELFCRASGPPPSFPALR